MMKKMMLFLLALSAAGAAFDVEDIKIQKQGHLQPRIFTDQEYVIAYYSEELCATAYSTTKDEDMKLRLPKVENLKLLWIRCAATLPDGFVLGVEEGRSSSERSNAIFESHAGLYFFDRKGESIGRTEIKDREILALAPQKTGTLLAAYKTPRHPRATPETMIGLAVVDRKGGLLEEPVPPKRYISEDYMKTAGITEAMHRLYRDPQGYVYINPVDGVISFLNLEGRETQKIRARMDLIPGKGSLWLAGWFPMGGTNVFRMMTRSYTGKIQSWAIGTDLHVLVPGDRVFIGIHKVGSDFCKAVGSPDGNFYVLRKITPENWTELTR